MPARAASGASLLSLDQLAVKLDRAYVLAGAVGAGLADARSAQPVVFEGFAIAPFGVDWLENTIATSRRPKTHLAYEWAVRVYIVPSMGSVPLVKLSPQHVQKLQRDMAAKGLSVATIGLVRGVLGTGLARAIKWGLVARNVVPLVDPPSGPKAEAQVLTPEQAAQLLLATTGDEFENLYRLLLATGLRIGEALGLRWTDIDPSLRDLRVRQQLVDVPEKAMAFSEPKSASGKRAVSIIPMAADALHAERARMLQNRLRAAKAWQEHNLVFSDDLGRPIDARVVRVHMHRAMAAIGLSRRVTPHTLRHSAATYLLAAGVPDRVVMEIMGHSSLLMTSRYEHVLSDMLTSAGVKLDQFFRTGTG